MKKKLTIFTAIVLASLGVYIVVYSPFSKPLQSTANSSSQPPNVIVKNISEDEAKAKAEEALINVGLTPGNLTVNIRKDNRTNKDIYVLDSDGAEVYLEPTTGKVLLIQDRKSYSNIIINITTQDQAKAQLEKLYAELQLSEGLTAGYKLAYVQNTGSKYWAATFQKEVIPGLLSPQEAIRISIDASGKFNAFSEVDIPVATTDVKITKERAIEIAKNNPDKDHRLDAPTYEQLTVVRPNHFTTTQDDKAVIAWAVRENGKYIWIDANTGEVVGGDQTL